MNEALGTSDIARLLRVSRPRVWQLRKRDDFPEPIGQDDRGHDYWYKPQILKWAAGAGRELAERAPLLWRPVSSGRPAHYLGTTMVDGHVVLTWDSELGRIGFIYAPDGFTTGAINRVLLQLLNKSGADTLVGMDALHYGTYGPDLVAVDAAAPDRQYGPRWTDLARVLGMPAPFWPSGLVHPEEIAKWRPGAPPAVLPARHELNIEPLLRLAADNEEASNPARATLHLARAITAQATRGAHAHIESLEDSQDRDAITLAATPLEPTHGEVDPAEDVLRSGWTQILGRTDTQAEACVELALQWDGGRYFPFSTIAHLRPERSAEAAAWAATLVPAEPNAAYVQFRSRKPKASWTDPATDLPAITDPKGELYAAVPQRLPALTPLHQVVFRDHQVWIRTEDGALYLAPQQSSCGISWGYSGSGPLTLAILLDRLLNDINAAATSWFGGEDPEAPAGLLYLTEHAPQDEASVFTRDQLLAARDA